VRWILPEQPRPSDVPRHVAVAPADDDKQECSDDKRVGTKLTGRRQERPMAEAATKTRAGHSGGPCVEICVSYCYVDA
jgi:hypothetical protein